MEAWGILDDLQLIRIEFHEVVNDKNASSEVVQVT